MRTLSSKNLRAFIFCTIFVLLCCAPLLFLFMRFFYTKDLDQLIVYRANEFISQQLPDFYKSDIAEWNTYNEDVMVLPYNASYVFNKPIEVTDYCKAEGHPIEYRILYREITIEGESFVLVSRIPMIEDHDLLGAMVTQYGSLFLILLVSLTILQRIISKNLWKPFYKTLNGIDSFSLEKGVIPEFEQANTVEFDWLNNRLSDLMTDNMSIYKRQKEFIENASHELQTPLAVFKSQLDILIQQPGLSQANTEVIQSLYNVLARMTRMNKNLLLLARIDNEQFAQIEEVDLIQTLYEQLFYLRELAESENLKMTVEVNDSLKVNANKLLVESLINNLVVNAIRHNIENGTIHIRVDKESFAVFNTGIMEELNADRIFRRFSRASEMKKGNGLGLSIVKQICHMHGWDIRYTFVDKKHCFTVCFN